MKKTLDLLWGVAHKTHGSHGCTVGYDNTTATPWWDCPTGSGIVGIPSKWAAARQQGWYEDGRSLRTKISLAASNQLRGIGAWTLHGALPTSVAGKAVWDAFAAYLASEGHGNQRVQG